MLKFVALVFAAVLTLALNRWLSQPSGPTTAPVEMSIRDLIRDPASNDGRSVRVQGRVIDRVSVFGAGAYRLESEPGTSLVVVGLATPPAPGAQLTVSGTFRVSATFGSFQAPVLVVQ